MIVSGKTDFRIQSLKVFLQVNLQEVNTKERSYENIIRHRLTMAARQRLSEIWHMSRKFMYVVFSFLGWRMVEMINMM